MESKTFSPGLEGVVACRTRLCHVDGARGLLIYGGNNAVDLALNSTFEQVWFLFKEGRFPTADEEKAFTQKILKLGTLSAAERRLIKKARVGSPVQSLRTAISMLGAFRGLEPWLNRDINEVDEESLALTAAVPEIIEILHHGRAPVRKPGLSSYVERYVWGITGQKPSAEDVAAVQSYMILTLDHGMPASTFAGLVTVSSGADVSGAFCSAISAFAGPLHGGAPGPVLDMLDAVGSEDNARAWIRGEIEAGRRLMGFGHRIYKVDDPRAMTLRKIAQKVKGGRVPLAEAVEREAIAALSELKPGRPLRVNVEFWTGVVLERAGIPRELFSSTFAAARFIGWREHLLEQIRDNKLFRPLSEYTGPALDQAASEK